MGFTDPHDPKREFDRYVMFAPDGTVAAMIEVAVGARPAVDAPVVNITKHGHIHIDDLTVTAADLATPEKAEAALEKAIHAKGLDHGKP